jgi:hypothetical protein
MSWIDPHTPLTTAGAPGPGTPSGTQRPAESSPLFRPDGHYFAIDPPVSRAACESNSDSWPDSDDHGPVHLRKSRVDPLQPVVTVRCEEFKIRRSEHSMLLTRPRPVTCEPVDVKEQ